MNRRNDCNVIEILFDLQSRNEMIRNSPLWYRIELIAVKKNSDTISTLPFNVMIVSLSFDVMMWEGQGRSKSWSVRIMIATN